jgi:hypothetical protein
MLKQGRREKTTVVVVQLDFNTAFTPTNPDAVYKTFEAYGVPAADIAVVKRMQVGSWYSVANSFGETAACALWKGMKQGCPGSPPFFLTNEDPLLRTLSATGKGWKLQRSDLRMGPGSGHRPGASRVREGDSDPVSAIVDDLVVVTIGSSAVADARVLLSLVELWEPWLGPVVNLFKSSCAAINFATSTQVDTSSIRYKGKSLPVQPSDQPFRYLGMLLTMTLNYGFEKARICRRRGSEWQLW